MLDGASEFKLCAHQGYSVELFFVHHGIKQIVKEQLKYWKEVGEMRTHSSKETRTHLVKMQQEHRRAPGISKVRSTS
jgi:hypothetical protein